MTREEAARCFERLRDDAERQAEKTARVFPGVESTFRKYVDLYNMAIDALRQPEKLESSDWISVKDQLPEPFVSVLVYMPGERPLPTVHEGYFVRDANKWYSHFFDRGLEEVTHWMPLPEAPEVEG